MYSVRDEIAYLRAEAARFRTKARTARASLRHSGNPVERIGIRSRVAEYVLEAQKRDRRASELRAQLPRGTG